MFPDILKRLRKNKQKTQKEMAEFLGITRQAYGHYENGSRQPDLSTIEKLADFFEVTTDYLIKGKERNVTDTDLSDDEKKMLAFFKNPELNLFFKEMAQSKEEQLEEMRQIWEIIKKRGLTK
ncbi:hypothetical protein BTO30_12045 [Domibacillus antri]|uniref:HTH cro/C1-type domain-containing protein n=1 Tax=Domibacillus antri TaxID=1714264 RepID=A0A1Q8Q3L0_9BACI|nr:helix-turn-helix transcriptional regulator [Domibacillus antri]OLN21930.1 hypothetical protein BTO30_12045 [Domibacillus antri]